MNYYLLTYDGSLKSESGEKVNAKYDLSNACIKCGTGALLIGNLPIKNPDKKEFYETYEGDLVISDNLFNELIKKEININYLKRLVNYKTKELLPFYHLLSNIILPKMSSRSTGIITENQCKFCKREGYFDQCIFIDNEEYPKVISRNYIFDNIDISLIDKVDIINTWECFTHSWLDSTGDLKYHFARPRLIVSDKFKKAFKELKIKHAVFDKVEINR